MTAITRRGFIAAASAAAPAAATALAAETGRLTDRELGYVMRLVDPQYDVVGREAVNPVGVTIIRGDMQDPTHIRAFVRRAKPYLGQPFYVPTESIRIRPLAALAERIRQAKADALAEEDRLDDEARAAYR